MTDTVEPFAAAWIATDQHHRDYRLNLARTEWCWDPLPTDANGWYVFKRERALEPVAATRGFTPICALEVANGVPLRADFTVFAIAPDGSGHAGPFGSAQEAWAFVPTSEAPVTSPTCRDPEWYVYLHRPTGHCQVSRREFPPFVKDIANTVVYGPFSSREAAILVSKSRHLEGVKPDSADAPKHHSEQRPRLDLLPTAPLEEVARVLAHGAEKYGEYNWCNGTRWGRCYRALLSHAWAWWRGEDTDPDSGLSHLAHCICNLLFLMEFQRNGWGEDDRFRGPTGAAFKKNDGLH
jgi:hypothetical protein